MRCCPRGWRWGVGASEGWLPASACGRGPLSSHHGHTSLSGRRTVICTTTVLENECCLSRGCCAVGFFKRLAQSLNTLFQFTLWIGKPPSAIWMHSWISHHIKRMSMKCLLHTDPFDCHFGSRIKQIPHFNATVLSLSLSLSNTRTEQTH